MTLFETVRKMYAFEKYKNVFGKEGLAIHILKTCSRYLKHNAFIINFSYSLAKKTRVVLICSLHVMLMMTLILNAKII